MTRNERVRRAILFQRPDRVPLFFWNRDQREGDVLIHSLTLDADGASEWGYRMRSLGNGTMGQPEAAVIPTWEALDTFRFPRIEPERRMAGAADFVRGGEGYYLLAGLGITGFNLYTFLRGFGEAMLDFIAEPERAMALMDRIMDFEMGLTSLAAEAGFDGVHFADDWGGQESLLIAPALWREWFKPRYRRQFEHAHRLGLHVWFHSCGHVDDILDDFHEIGVDVMNVSQPNVNPIEAIGARLRGAQCFLAPISYQTVSISGTRAEILAEARRLHDTLGAADGGFIGYVEEYGCMGMSEENYRACAAAFRALNGPSPVRR
ncbi:MAG TPA: uroporphyrinogen decarboxylase family protein [Candidatus Hydrogenedentes bacterium]|nr:uroporphyrinogen decarboxylase family protein [Candidatus Hydrogenedentota bacterium]HNT86239.1 uroporphyrinogen decarboxylase family protein [Candidatus Hydrogenedentota bacterium]